MVFSTENKESYVAVDSYVVASPSRGFSAANRTPRWTADLYIDFTLRGARRPVHKAGLYIAHVYPGGSGLEAYDADGAIIARIYTHEMNNDFLGIASERSIARLRVFRVQRIDPNFTIDDLTFE